MKGKLLSNTITMLLVVYLVGFLGTVWSQPITKIQNPAQKISLPGQESLGGHTIARHVGKDANFIKNRVIEQTLDAASTFPNLQTAEEVVQDALEYHRTAINTILFSPRSGEERRAFQYNAGKNIGSYLKEVNVVDKKGRQRKDKALKNDATSATLVIRITWNPNWNIKNPHSCYILTCYPNPKK